MLAVSRSSSVSSRAQRVDHMFARGVKPVERRPVRLPKRCCRAVGDDFLGDTVRVERRAVDDPVVEMLVRIRAEALALVADVVCAAPAAWIPARCAGAPRRPDGHRVRAASPAARARPGCPRCGGTHRRRCRGRRSACRTICGGAADARDSRSGPCAPQVRVCDASQEIRRRRVMDEVILRRQCGRSSRGFCLNRGSQSRK